MIIAQTKNEQSGRFFLYIFSVALFSSALLMFLIQPLVAKALLPKLGGTPQVWTTCMVFFQAMLFAGYLHAHFTGVLFGLRRQAVIHVGLALLALFALPIGLASNLAAADSGHPVLWLLQTLLISVGAPMFIISATAPLLQKWVSHTRHPAAHDPYFLYAASNAGSLLALLAYPAVIEPVLDLRSQIWWWGIGYAVLVVMLAVCLRELYKNFAPQVSENGRIEEASSVTPAARLRWVLLSFAPSSLLLGVTAYITTDVASVPLFWIVPLTLYLLTFILVFSRKQIVPRVWTVRVQAVFLTLLVVATFAPELRIPAVLFPLHLLVFFLTALVCHGELARSRPDARRLTEFYLWLSLGGMLGGIFNAILAPVIFDRLVEYPLALTLACMLRPSSIEGGMRRRMLDLALPPALVFGLALALRALASSDTFPKAAGESILLIAAALAILSFSTRSIRFGLAVGAALFYPWLFPNLAGQTAPLATDRSFFGIYKVNRDDKLEINTLVHGTTMHGAQYRNPERALRPLSYYSTEGPFGDIFRALKPGLKNQPVALVGMGAGALTCYGGQGDPWTIYEIDPLVEKIARDPRYFTYLRDCPPKLRVVLGDARLSLRDAADGEYALIIVDAFSSDAIPTHLLTREAMAGYLAKLRPDGLLAIHISNRYINLGPVVGNLAQSAGLIGRIKSFEGDGSARVSATTLTLVARNEAALGPLANESDWKPLPTRLQTRIWSDDYVNIPGALKIFEKWQ